MPSKFVQNTAARMGTSVEHAEKVWADAKHAVKKGKRQGSWYWGKVVNTFKRMMGINEAMTFKDFQELQTEILEEEKRITLPPLANALPKTIMLGSGGYYLKLVSVSPTRAHFDLGRILSDTQPIASLTVSLKSFPGQKGRRFLVQGHGHGITDGVSWENRSAWVDLPDHPLTVGFIKTFMNNVLGHANMLEEDKKEGGIKKSYLDFKGSRRKKKLKDEMKREIKRYSKMDSKDKDAYPDDWTADQKYKADLKKKGKTLPKSSHTSKYHEKYGK